MTGNNEQALDPAEPPTLPPLRSFKVRYYDAIDVRRAAPVAVVVHEETIAAHSVTIDRASLHFVAYRLAGGQPFGTIVRAFNVDQWVDVTELQTAEPSLLVH